MDIVSGKLVRRAYDNSAPSIAQIAALFSSPLRAAHVRAGLLSLLLNGFCLIAHPAQRR